MITLLEEDYILNYAYVPEHITSYVIAISQGEPFLLGDYLCYNRKGHLIFVGYPLKEPFKEREMNKILDTAIERFRPEYIALIAPEISISREVCSRRDSDCYYKLDLSDLHIGQKLKNMIKRASRELCIEKRQELRDEHTQLISEFLISHKIDDTTRYIFERVPAYISSVPTAWVFSARDKAGRLVAFDIAEFGAKNVAFYMFNFMSSHHPYPNPPPSRGRELPEENVIPSSPEVSGRGRGGGVGKRLLSRQYYIPGASDLLLYEIIKTAIGEGKSFINLGLGINEGVTFFKKKWGAIPFLHYEFCLYQPARMEGLKSLFQKL